MMVHCIKPTFDARIGAISRDPRPHHVLASERRRARWTDLLLRVVHRVSKVVWRTLDDAGVIRRSRSLSSQSLLLSYPSTSIPSPSPVPFLTGPFG